MLLSSYAFLLSFKNKRIRLFLLYTLIFFQNLHSFIKLDTLKKERRLSVVDITWDSGSHNRGSTPLGGLQYTPRYKHCFVAFFDAQKAELELNSSPAL